MNTDFDFEPKTHLLDDKVNVRERLENLQQWQEEVDERDNQLLQRLYELEIDRKKAIDKAGSRLIDQKQYQIGILRRRYKVLIAKIPFETSMESLANGGYQRIYDNLAIQYAALSKRERQLWLNNLHFIMTPDVRNLNAKLSHILRRTMQADHRNLLIGGDSGSGKTRFMEWRSAQHLTQVEGKRNYAPVILVEAIKNDKTSKSLLQQMLLDCGLNYFGDDTVPDLFNKIGSTFQVCGVKLVMVDELNHLVDLTQRRRLLEISNRTVSTSIVGAAVDPLKFREGSPEIQGRFIDYYPLQPYRGAHLSALLSVIEALLPFSKPSFLAHRTKTIKEGKKQFEQEWIASFIEKKTRGSFRYIMHLIKDAAEIAIEENMPNLTLSLLQQTWDTIQTHDPDQCED